jgi:hypothetical protein
VTLTRISAVDVAKCFESAWPKADKYPDEIACHHVSKQINTVVDLVNVKTRKKPSSQDAAATRTFYIDAHKHGRAFVRCVPELRAHLEKSVPQVQVPELLAGFECGYHAKIVEAHNEAARAISAVDDAKRAIDEFLKRCPTPEPTATREPMRWIADAAEYAWKRTTAKTKMSVKEDGPATEFVRLVIEKIGLRTDQGTRYSTETISDHLRERHKRKRSGNRRTKEGGAN